MSKTSTKKRPNNRKPTLPVAALAATKKRLSLASGNNSTSRSKPHKKARKNVPSHQQSIQARDTLDAEYRDWRTGTTSVMDLSQPPDGSTTTPMTLSQTARPLGSPSMQISEQSVQDLAGVLSAL